jgi:hypothetical protein
MSLYLIIHFNVAYAFLKDRENGLEYSNKVLLHREAAYGL